MIPPSGSNATQHSPGRVAASSTIASPSNGCAGKPRARTTWAPSMVRRAGAKAMVVGSVTGSRPAGPGYRSEMCTLLMTVSVWTGRNMSGGCVDGL